MLRRKGSIDFYERTQVCYLHSPFYQSAFPITNLSDLRFICYKNKARFDAIYPHGPWKRVEKLKDCVSRYVPRNGSAFALPECDDHDNPTKYLDQKILYALRGIRPRRSDKYEYIGMATHYLYAYGIKNDIVEHEIGTYLFDHWIYHAVVKGPIIEYIHLVFAGLIVRFGWDKKRQEPEIKWARVIKRCPGMQFVPPNWRCYPTTTDPEGRVLLPWQARQKSAEKDPSKIRKFHVVFTKSGVQYSDFIWARDYQEARLFLSQKHADMGQWDYPYLLNEVFDKSV